MLCPKERQQLSQRQHAIKSKILKTKMALTRTPDPSRSSYHYEFCVVEAAEATSACWRCGCCRRSLGRPDESDLSDGVLYIIIAAVL